MRALILTAFLIPMSCTQSAEKPVSDSAPSVSDSGATDSQPEDSPVDTEPVDDSGQDTDLPQAPPIVVIMVGDGMGQGQLDVGSLLRTGETGQLALQALPVHAQVRSSSLSGLTDSAAAATAMATGHMTLNGRLGMDPLEQPLENIIEVATALGVPTGVVSTAALPHATPAAFSVHAPSRHDYMAIADLQALESRPTVMLGGGAQWYLPSDHAESVRGDDGLIAPMQEAGCQVVMDAPALEAASLGGCLVGLFAGEHLEFERLRPPEMPQPSLSEMTLAALNQLDTPQAGFFLMVEGARIDMAGHGNDLSNLAPEVLAFDDAVTTVLEWASDRPEVTLVVTADHETGGLEVVTPGAADELSEVLWRHGQHSNALVDLYAQGPGTQALHGQLLDHRWVHALSLSRLTGAELVPPAPMRVPDGYLGDLGGAVSTQDWTTGFGEGFNQLDALHLSADAQGLWVGLEGVFEWDANAVTLLIDLDYGAATGHPSLDGALTDSVGSVDSVLTSLPLAEAPTAGLGFDMAVTSLGGAGADLGITNDRAGARGFGGQLWDPGNFSWLRSALVFGEGVRGEDTPTTPTPGEGLEVFVRWQELWPGLVGGVPAGTTLAVAAVLTSGDGFLSNQLLPPLTDGSDNPGRQVTGLPGVVVMTIDSNGDGRAEDPGAPQVVR